MFRAAGEASTIRRSAAFSLLGDLLMKRIVIPEFLDTDSGTPAEVAENLNDLGKIHRWFGGISTTQELVLRTVKRSGRNEVSLLDVASGSGELPLAVRDRLKRRGIPLTVTLLDRAPSHLNGSASAVIGDALATPFPHRAFDVVSSSLFVHHLEPPEIVRFANECLRVCRIAVIINDLRRSWLQLAAVYAGFLLFRNRLTRHDGPASVRRAYTVSELRGILEQSQAARIEITTHYLFRVGAILWK